MANTMLRMPDPEALQGIDNARRMGLMRMPDLEAMIREVSEGYTLHASLAEGMELIAEELDRLCLQGDYTSLDTLNAIRDLVLVTHKVDITNAVRSLVAEIVDGSLFRYAFVSYLQGQEQSVPFSSTSIRLARIYAALDRLRQECQANPS